MAAIWAQAIWTASAASISSLQAVEFRLPATDGKTYALDDVAGKKGTVVVFVCNHCPYVKAVIDRMVADARVLMSEGLRRFARTMRRAIPMTHLRK